MYLDEFAAQQIRNNPAPGRRPERPAQIIGRYWREDARGRRVRPAHRAPAWLRVFRAH